MCTESPKTEQLSTPSTAISGNCSSSKKTALSAARRRAASSLCSDIGELLLAHAGEFAEQLAGASNIPVQLLGGPPPRVVGLVGEQDADLGRAPRIRLSRRLKQALYQRICLF